MPEPPRGRLNGKDNGKAELGKTMTIDKAIKILTIHNDHNPDYTDAERNDAHQLGIEALKRVRAMRSYPNLHDRVLLLGETETEA